jgi:formylglycine-generating enzyme required for sulfatase activity
VAAPGDSGTAGYRAPEATAATGEPAPTLDVYAVAALLYEMLEGRLPAMDEAGALVPAAPAALNPRQWAVLASALDAQPGRRPATVADLLARLNQAAGPTAEERAAEEAAARKREEERTRLDALQRQQAAEAAAAVRLLAERQRKEQEARQKVQEEAARQERKAQLRQQLLARRDADAEEARRQREEQQRKSMQARALAAYRAEQQRVRPAETDLAEPAAPAAMLAPDGQPMADEDGVLRDRFVDATGVGPDLVLIPTGRFQMGSPDQERRRAIEAGAQKHWVERETPQRWVGIARPFAMGRYPVTVGEWRQFVRATGWQAHGEVNWDAPGFSQDERHPVVGVTWYDAQQYVHWLSERTGQRYRLPSEAEWEYCCRAGTKTAFSFGDSISTEQANYDGNYTWFGGAKGVFRGGTSPAGLFPPNPWGLFDMHGNVWEWVQDPVHDTYAGAPADGRVWDEGGDPNRRILRGGCWLYNPRYLRSALRNGFAASMCNDIVGFRIVRELTS